MGLTWNGDALKRKVRAASAIGVDATMAAGVEHARRNHPWRNRTGFTEGSIWLMTAAAPDARGVRGRWGSDAQDALPLEIGTSRIGPTAGEREAQGDGDMWDIPAPEPEPGVTVEQDFTILPPGTMDGQEDWVTLHRPSHGTGPLMEARPYLRPAADVEYPRLAERIRIALAAMQ